MEKKIVFTFSSLFLLLSSILIINSIDFKSEIKVPFGSIQQIEPICDIHQQITIRSTIRQYKILFDEAHLPAALIGNDLSDHKIAANLRHLRTDLKYQGHLIDSLGPGNNINQSLLNNYDLLVIFGSAGSYTTNEIDAIELWVRNGGNLLFAARGYYEYAEDIIERFGFVIHASNLRDDLDAIPANSLNIEFDNIKLHPISANLNSIVNYRTRPIISQPSEAADIVCSDIDDTTYINSQSGPVYFNDIPIISAISNSPSILGSIIVCGSFNMWVSTSAYTSSIDLNYLKADNQQIAINTFNWLVDKENILTIDSDLDNLTDYRELYYYNSNPNLIDSDLDNLTDTYEAEIGTDLSSNDTDCDNLTDYEELYIYNSFPTNPDSDNDDLIDGEEVYTYHTNLTNFDTDSDIVSDGYEINNLMDPLDPSDAILDFDDDLLLNWEEFKAKSSALSNDTDTDSLSDYDEVKVYFTSPVKIDTDGDNLTDSEEILIHHTNPRKRDTDGDKISDYNEILTGSDPLDPNDPIPRTNYTPATTINIPLPSIAYFFIIVACSSCIYSIINKKLEIK